jgi:hypothetical protein
VSIVERNRSRLIVRFVQPERNQHEPQLGGRVAMAKKKAAKKKAAPKKKAAKKKTAKKKA